MLIDKPWYKQTFGYWTVKVNVTSSGVPRGVWGVQTPLPPSEMPKALQNRAKLNLIVNC